MFYIEDDRRLTPAFPVRAGVHIAPPAMSALPVAAIRRDLADAAVLLDRIDAALPK